MLILLLLISHDDKIRPHEEVADAVRKGQQKNGRYRPAVRKRRLGKIREQQSDDQRGGDDNDACDVEDTYGAAIDALYPFPVIFRQRLIEKLPEGKRIRQFTDIEEIDDLGYGQLQAVHLGAVGIDKKANLNKADDRQNNGRNRTDDEVVETVAGSRRRVSPFQPRILRLKSAAVFSL